MKLKQASILAVGTVLVLASVQASASESGDLKWNGYLNVNGSISDSKTEYRDDVSEDSTFSSTNFGLTAAKRINSKLSIAGQMHGEHDVFAFDWGYATYRFSSSLTGKAGKIKYPGTLVAETIDIGVTYPWTQAPVSVYGEGAGLSFEAYTGTALAYSTGDDVEFGAEFYSGETKAEGINNKRLLGIVFSATTDNIRAQLSVNNSIMEFEDLTGLGPIAVLMQGRTTTNLGLGVKAEYDLMTIYTEYVKTTMSGLPQMDRVGWYFTAVYEREGWKPHITYQSYKGMQGREETGIALGMNRQLDISIVLKIDVQQVEPINGGFFEAQPSDDKVNLLNVSLSMVF